MVTHLQNGGHRTFDANPWADDGKYKAALYFCGYDVKVSDRSDSGRCPLQGTEVKRVA